MKKLIIIPLFAVCAIFVVGSFLTLDPKEQDRNAGGKKPDIQKQKDTKNPEEKDTGDLDLDNREFDIDEREDKRLEDELEQETRQYASLRKKKDVFSFHIGFSIGGIGYGVVGGPVAPTHELYKISYVEKAFQFGFRGAIEGMFYPKRQHCIGIGAAFEQRKPEIKINYLPLSYLLLNLPAEQFLGLYYSGLIEKYLSRNVVTLNYLTLPVTYRYYFRDEFYVGMGLDIALLMQGKTNFSTFLLKWKLNLKNMLAPVDFGGKVIFGFATSNIFIEVAVGAGILKLDTMRGERRSMYLTAMVGYRL
jgi:hypothetical protein